MRPIQRIPGLLLALIAVPALAGCSALGLPDLGSTVITLDATTDPLASQDPLAPTLPAPTPGYYASADGYSLTMPVGWGAVTITAEQGPLLIDLLAGLDPTLGELARAALDGSGARITMVGADLTAAAVGEVGPSVAVATLRTRGMPKDAARAQVEALLAAAPLMSEVTHTVVTLPAGDAHRYDAVIAGATITVQLSVYVFRVGGDSFVVGVAAPQELFAGAGPAFDAIIKSLRFGV
jgi:hypothetical protein